MKIIKTKKDLEVTVYADRNIYKAVGKDGPVMSTKMTVGYGDYSTVIGSMEPHRHAEETVYIIEAQNAYLRCGDARNNLGERTMLKTGMLIHFDEMEWHVFECDENGFASILFIYGQVDRIRPEET